MAPAILLPPSVQDESDISLISFLFFFFLLNFLHLGSREKLPDALALCSLLLSYLPFLPEEFPPGLRRAQWFWMLSVWNPAAFTAISLFP